jgi:hypothetical protein
MPHEIDTPGHISEIELWAAEMGDRDPIKARSLIIGWSVFTGDHGPVSINNKTWGQVSPGWTRQIWFKARKAYAEFKKQPNLELDFKEKIRMPEVSDNGSDLPF